MPDGGKPEIDLHAACACGQVAVHAKGRVAIMLLCSCEDCQRATGAGHAAVFSLPTADFTVSGEVAAFARPADSGATFTHHFCARCGTPIFGRSSRAEAMVLIPIGLFGRESQWFAPNQLVFARSHRAWDTIAAELPQYATYR